jgi:hypothetical protein
MEIPNEFKGLYEDGVIQIERLRAKKAIELENYKQHIKAKLPEALHKYVDEKVFNISPKSFSIVFDDMATYLTIKIEKVFGTLNNIVNVDLSFHVCAPHKEKFITDDVLVAIAVLFGEKEP